MQVNRSEHKYMITLPEALIMKKRISAVMPMDKNCVDGRPYEIRSLYFDTIHNRSCYEKSDGLRIHEKFRMRIYGSDDSLIKLESKRKDGIHQIKKTMIIPRDIADRLCHGDYEGLRDFDHPLAPYFYANLSKGMIPKVIIQYKRLSFCLDTNNTRITFDSDICATESNMDIFKEELQTHPILGSDKMILEVKFNGFLFSYVKKALNGLKKSTTAYSKYMSGRNFY